MCTQVFPRCTHKLRRWLRPSRNLALTPWCLLPAADPVPSPVKVVPVSKKVRPAGIPPEMLLTICLPENHSAGLPVLTHILYVGTAPFSHGLRLITPQTSSAGSRCVLQTYGMFTNTDSPALSLCPPCLMYSDRHLNPTSGPSAPQVVDPKKVVVSRQRSAACWQRAVSSLR